MFVNLSNHPSSGWSKEQHEAASQYGEIKDIPFPVIDPGWDTELVEICAIDYLGYCKDLIQENKISSVIHLMGEHIFCFILAQLLLKEGYVCLTSTTERIVSVCDNVKTSCFVFVSFRKYKLI